MIQAGSNPPSPSYPPGPPSPYPPGPPGGAGGVGGAGAAGQAYSPAPYPPGTPYPPPRNGPPPGAAAGSGDAGQVGQVGQPVLPGGAGSRREARTALAPNRRGEALRSLFEGSPGRLRRLGIVAVLASLVLSVVGSAAFSTRQSALADARADAAQLIRVQQIATLLVKADSLFTNGNLAYGLESTKNLALYDNAIAGASEFLAEASRANGEDAPELAKVNTSLTLYTSRVASSRANNNQAFQVSTGYLRQASDLLRGNDKTKIVGMLPTLQQVMADNTKRIDAAYSRSRWAMWILVAAALLALGGLVVVQLRLARMTHRYLNLPLVAATATVFLVLAGGAGVMFFAQHSADTVYDHSYTDLQNVASARISAYTAKSAESIALNYRGNGGDPSGPEQRFTQATSDAAARLAKVGGVDELNAWLAQHAAVFKLAGTDWQAAAKQATTEGTAGQPTINSTFDAFNQATEKILDDRADTAGRGLLAGRLSLLVLTWAAVVLGVVAAAMAWGGVSQRLEEYR